MDYVSAGIYHFGLTYTRAPIRLVMFSLFFRLLHQDESNKAPDFISRSLPNRKKRENKIRAWKLPSKRTISYEFCDRKNIAGRKLRTERGNCLPIAQLHVPHMSSQMKCFAVHICSAYWMWQIQQQGHEIRLTCSFNTQAMRTSVMLLLCKIVFLSKIPFKCASIFLDFNDDVSARLFSIDATPIHHIYKYFSTFSWNLVCALTLFIGAVSKTDMCALFEWVLLIAIPESN